MLCLNFIWLADRLIVMLCPLIIVFKFAALFLKNVCFTSTSLCLPVTFRKPLRLSASCGLTITRKKGVGLWIQFDQQMGRSLEGDIQTRWETFSRSAFGWKNCRKGGGRFFYLVWGRQNKLKKPKSWIFFELSKRTGISDFSIGDGRRLNFWYDVWFALESNVLDWHKTRSWS